MDIYGIKTLQNGIGLFCTKMTVSQLSQIGVVDYADPATGKLGYQRKPDEKRFFELAKFLTTKDSKSKGNAILPPAIIASYRGALDYKEGKNGFCEITVPDGEKLWIIDGQHRFGGLMVAAGLYSSKSTGKKVDAFKAHHAKFQTFEVPVIIIESRDVDVEAYQFSVINSEAKKVDKYLAIGGVLKGGGPIPTSQNAWQGRAHVACERLRLDTTSPLRGKIKHPNDKGRFWCTAKGMMNALKFPLNSGTYAAEWDNGHSEKVCRMLIDYWNAWEKVAPFCFINHKEYALFKSSGITAFNYCLNAVAQKAGKKFPSQDDFVDVLSALGRYKSKVYWHINTPDGINLQRGYGQIIDEANKICAAILK